MFQHSLPRDDKIICDVNNSPCPCYYLPDNMLVFLWRKTEPFVPEEALMGNKSSNVPQIFMQLYLVKSPAKIQL